MPLHHRKPQRSFVGYGDLQQTRLQIPEGVFFNPDCERPERKNQSF